MCNQKTTFILILFLFLFTSGYSQQAIVATGGDATGIGGTMSSSSGLTDFQYISNDLWSLQFGVQQTHKAQVVDIDPDPPEGGEIIGGGNHPIGSEVSLIAQPNPGWEFVMWIGNFHEVSSNNSNSQSTNNPIVILIQEDTYITAVFQLSDSVPVPTSNWSLVLGIILIIGFMIIRTIKLTL